MPLYADIVLPLAQPAYTFAVPEGMHVEAGQAVAVQFGARKFYTGIVWRVHDRRPPFKTVKSIQRVLYGAPLLSAQQMAFWEWVAAYYMCTPGEVMRVGLPSLMKPSGDTEEEITEEEFRPRTECYVALAPGLHDEGRLHEAFEKLERRAPRQYEALLELASAGDGERIPTGEVARRLLRADYAVLHALERKGYIVSAERERTVERGGSAFRLPELTPAQLAALESLRGQFARKPAALLHGITGSGKTEVFLCAIEEELKAGRNAIVLVPEISLTPQTVARFRGRFGDTVAVLHSRMSQGERFDQWDLIHSGEIRVVVGARSALFAPLANVGMIIIDEEHEGSYKQDQAPRYVTRDVAEWLVRRNGATLILGSATPSIEALHRAKNDDSWHQVVMASRANGKSLPDIQVVDMAREFGAGNRKMFSKALQDALDETLDKGEKAVLLLNQRGFAQFLLCRDCGFVPECESCSTSLTYHEEGNRLVCHHCGYEIPAPVTCPDCGSPYLKRFGAGTQRVEAELRVFLGERACEVVRMDADTTAHKGDHQRLLEQFAKADAAVLLGTQMIAKGLDFDDVTLVGVINADTMLHLPDFRSSERTFDLIEQVAGRSGRADLPGKVIVQTYSAHDDAIAAAARYDRERFLEQELKLRHDLSYPPFVRMANVLIWGERESEVIGVAQQLFFDLMKLGEERGAQGIQIFPPTPCVLSRLKKNFRYHILIKAQPTEDISAFCIDYFRSRKPHKTVNVSIDIDPVSVL